MNSTLSGGLKIYALNSPLMPHTHPLCTHFFTSQLMFGDGTNSKDIFDNKGSRVITAEMLSQGHNISAGAGAYVNWAN